MNKSCLVKFNSRLVSFVSWSQIFYKDVHAESQISVWENLYINREELASIVKVFLWNKRKKKKTKNNLKVSNMEGQ